MKSHHQRSIGLPALGIALFMHITVACASLPSSIPFKATSDADDNLIYRAIGAFLLAAAVAYGIAWFLKRYLPTFEKKLGRVGSDRQLERLESLRLSPKAVLVRVRWGDKELLVGESDHGVTLLCSRPLHQTVAEPERNEATKDKHD